MKLAKQIFNFYLDASIHVAVSVFCLLEITAVLLNININQNLAYFCFFSTIACYNFIKYGVEAEKYILVANRYFKNIQVLSFLAMGCAVYFAFFLHKDVWLCIGALGLFTGLYALPVLPKAKNLRSFGALKIFMVAIVWAGVTVLLPVLSANMSVTTDVWIETFQRFLIVLILLMPFEIRDLAYDSPSLKTIPQRFGIIHTKLASGIVVLIFFFTTYLKNTITPLDLIAKGILFLSFGFLVLYTQGKQGKYFASFWVEAFPIFWYVVIYAINYLLGNFFL
ncbi:MAG: hypothetical protein ACSHW4_00820 [Cellulophaga sp.]|uniref:hypothetical protein n=1 Tax=unclassified Cellulophaga TaxID=2634405 RepID=UPI000C2C5301|nr:MULTISPECIES: hypothetical protein [unclassified Cellulophaga]MDO6490501.1 hypothetical protein [Cellulophaga sp. 2_MG-2023]MDO6494305.1 hypothetical protein [Cellulophaga sp. 3_MG-2023]PKB41858.1 hypothetical protein AX016_0011 [Cellulophaga sp. RHA19]